MAVKPPTSTALPSTSLTQTAKLVESIKLPGGDPAGRRPRTIQKKIVRPMGDIIDGDSHVAVVDLEKHKVVAQWPITDACPHTAGLGATIIDYLLGADQPNTGEIEVDTSMNLESWW